jgi:hypothetical protein
MLNKAGRAYESMHLLRALSNKRPKLFGERFPRYLATLAEWAKKDGGGFLGDSRYPGVISAFLKRHPGQIDGYLSKLDGTKPLRDAVGLACLRGVTLTEQQKETACRKIGRVLPRVSELETLYHMALLAVDSCAKRTLLHGLILKLYRTDGGTRDHCVPNLAHLVDARDEWLAGQLKRHFEMMSISRKISACRAILNALPDDGFATAHLLDVARNGSDLGRVTTAIEILAIHRRLPLLDKERYDFLYSDKDMVHATNSALCFSPENALRAADAIVRHMSAMADTWSSGLGDLLWRNPELQRRLAPALLKLLRDGNLKEKKFASDVMANAALGMRNHLDALRGLLANEWRQDLQENLLWAIANIGVDAAPLAEPIRKRYERASGVLRARSRFALSRISPEKEERLKYVKLLMRRHETAPKDLKRSVVRMLGLRKEFEKVTHPFLVSVLLDGRLPDDHRKEAAWGLQRVRPFTRDAMHGFRRVLEETATPAGYEKHKGVVSTVVWSVRQHPASAYGLLLLLDALPVKEKLNLSFWLSRRALVEEAKRQETKPTE